VVAVGNGDSGQLGEGLSARRGEPVPVLATGALAGRTVVALSAGSDHSLALCADGGVVAWGLNSSRQLGTGSVFSSIAVPTDVDATGALAGKQVVAVSAGSSHSLALCSDGTLVAWGLNTAGQLGNGTLTSSPVPVEVDRSGALAGKTVVAISAGDGHNLVLCSDGSVAAWGVNSYGQLGDNLTVNSPLPKTVHLRDIHGQGRIIAVAAGSSFSLALDADGVVSAWGRNDRGQLGNGSSDHRRIPVAVVRSGVLTSRRIVAIQAGSSCTAIAR
jgi:alpha-tubulin suppressor-like RCC1 family protein